MAIEEAGDGGVGGEVGGTFGELVALVLETQVFDGYATSAQGGDDLLRLADRHARIVGAVDDEHRRGDAVHLVDGRDVFEEVAVVLQAAVLGLTQPATPGSGVFQERHEIGDADDVHAGGPYLGIGGDSGQHHEAAVAAAPDGDAPRVGDAALGQPRRRVLEVMHRIHA